MRPAIGRRAATALIVPALALAGPLACGGGDDEELPTPTIDVPAGEAPTVPDEESRPERESGGTGPGQGGQGGDARDPAAAYPPTKPGSAQDAFERFCEENPEACG